MLQVVFLGIRINFHSFVGRIFPKALTHPQLACSSPDFGETESRSTN